MTKDDALRMMLGPFKAWRDVPGNEDVVEELTKIINAVEKVLAQPEQEPVFTYEQVKAHIQVAMMSTTTPPQRTWVGLTDKVITKVVESMPRGIKGWMSDWDLYDYARAIEAKLKEKNT
jgi:hypothetical protein